MRHLPGLGEATEGGAVEHGVTLGGLTAREGGGGQSKDEGRGGRKRHRKSERKMGTIRCVWSVGCRAKSGAIVRMVYVCMYWCFVKTDGKG